MADKKFGVKQINLIGASGTPNLTSPNNLNINATTVAISTDVTIGGQVSSNVIVGSGYSVGIGTTLPTASLDVRGQTNLANVNVSGVVTASSFVGNGSGLTGIGNTANVRSDTLTVSGVSTFSGISTYTSTIFGKQLTVSGVTTTLTLNVGTGSSIIHTNEYGVGIGTTADVNASFAGGSSRDKLLVSGRIRSFGPYTATEGITNGISVSSDREIIKGLLIYDDGTTPSGSEAKGVRLTAIDESLKLNANGFSGGDYSAILINQNGVGIATTNPQSSLQVGTGITMYASTGIISATSFYGSFNGSITNATNLTGGYANASQLNVTGVTTIAAGRIQADASSNLRFGNLAAGSGSVRNIAIGDQVLFSLSGGTGRNIGIGELSYYDTTSGSYNIGVGINAGQKITTGSYNVIIGGYNGQTGLDLRTSSNNVVIADGQGNIRQYIDSSGNVGIKTTTASEALTVSGIVSATSFYGTLNAAQLTGVLPVLDGSNLFGVTASGTGIIVKDDGSTVGTAGTIDFGSNLSVTFASGIATVSGASSVSAATTAYALAGTPNLNVGIVTATRLVSSGASLTSPLIVGITTATYGIRFADDAGSGSSTYVVNVGTYYIQGFQVGAGYWQDRYLSLSNSLNYILPNVGIGTTNATSKLTVSGGVNVSGVVTATSFSGSGSGLTNIPAGQLTGALPAIDASALLNVNATGSGIVVEDDAVNVGSARTVNFGTGLDVTYSASGIATISASGGSLQSRTVVSGITTAIVNNGIGNTDITGFKSYSLLKVGLSTAAWLRLYTDSTSRANDSSRSVGVDPLAGSGVIAEVVTTGISTTQIISPFVMGGNLDTPATTTIYAAITNLSGITSTISVDLTILQLEA